MKLRSLLFVMATAVISFSSSAYAMQLTIYNCPVGGGPSDNGCVKNSSTAAYLDYNVNGTTYWMWYQTPINPPSFNAGTPVTIYKGDSTTGAPTTSQCTVVNFSSTNQGLNCFVQKVDDSHANVLVNY